MDFNKLINNNGMYFYKDDSFNTISASFCFKGKVGNRENAIYDFLCNYLLKSNSIYNSEELDKKRKELYNIGLSVSSSLTGKQRILTFHIDMVSPSVVEDDYSKEAFKFAKERFFSPDFTRDDNLEMLKKERISSFKASLSSPSVKAKNLYNSMVYNNPDMEYEYSTDIKYMEDLINSITLEEMKQLYEETINNENFYRGLMFGNATLNDFNEFKKNFPFNSKLANLDFDTKESIKDGVIVVPNEDTNESIVYQTYNIDSSNRGIRMILRDIYSGSSDLCLYVLRNKHGLVYNASTILYPFSDKFVVKACVDKNNIDKLIEATDELISISQDEKQIKPMLERAKESIRNDDYIMSEDRDDVVYELTSHIRGMFPEFNHDEFMDKLDEVKEEDVTSVTKTLKRKSIFVYRGDAK